MKVYRILKFIIWGIIFILSVLLVYFNNEVVEVSFGKYSAELPVGLTILGGILVGGIIVYIYNLLKNVSSELNSARKRRNLFQQNRNLKRIVKSAIFLWKGMVNDSLKILGEKENLKIGEEEGIVRSSVLCALNKHEDSLRVLRNYYNSPEKENSLSPLFFSRLIDEYIHNGDALEAVRVYERIDRKDVKNDLTVKKSARTAYILKGDIEKALVLQKEISSSDKGNIYEKNFHSQLLTQAFLTKGYEKEKKGREKYLLEALSVNPEFIPAYDFLGKFHLEEENNLSRAVKTWLKGYESTLAYVLLIRIMDAYIKQNLPDELINFAESLRQSKFSPATEIFRIRVFIRLGLIDRAIEIIDNLDTSTFTGVWEHRLSLIRMMVGVVKGDLERVRDSFKDIEKYFVFREENLYFCKKCRNSSSQWKLICEKCSSIGEIAPEEPQG